MDLTNARKMEHIKMVTQFRNSTRPEECGTSGFKGYVKNLFASIAYQARFD
jgi:hypothetical protein